MAVYTWPVLPSLKTIDWSGFLGRARLPSPTKETLGNLRGRTVLVTGAGGSIGSALAMRLSRLGARPVLLESSESRLFALQGALQQGGVTGVLGSVGDRALVDEVFEEFAPEIVLHAAAFKHVPLLEEHPLAAVGNNVFGTLCLVDIARAHRAQVVLLSTDKAVEPASVMGATKAVAEQIVLRGGGVALRLGNVLATRDSVAEIFAGQLQRGEPLSITDPAARRYFMTVDEAVNLLLTAAGTSTGPALLAPVLEAEHLITDLARFLADRLAPGRVLDFEFTQPRPGHKEAEQLWGSGERVLGNADPGLVRLAAAARGQDSLDRGLEALQKAWEARNITRCIESLRALTPGYRPSSMLLSVAGRPRMQVGQ